MGCNVLNLVSRTAVLSFGSSVEYLEAFDNLRAKAAARSVFPEPQTLGF